MAEYIKMIIVAIFTGLTAPLPVSSAAHFNFFSNVVGMASDEGRMSLYFNSFMLMFAVVIFVSFRKIYLGSLKSLFISKKKEEAYRKSEGFRKVAKNLVFTVLPTLLLFIPVSKEKILIDLFDSFLNLNSLILAGISCVITAAILALSLWYTSKNDSQNESTKIKSALRFSFYQLPCYIIPGFSHIAAGSVNLLLNDVKIKTFISETYVYLAPSLFLVSLVKLIRCISSGVLVDPVSLIIGMIVFAVATKLIISLVTKQNLRRIFAVFSAYSLIFGAFIALISFYLN